MTPIVRRLILCILLIGMVGSLVELVLLDHDEDLNQWIPLVLLTVGIDTSRSRPCGRRRRSFEPCKS